VANKQNLTVSLDADTIRKAKILAAGRNTSVTKLLTGYVEEMIAEEERYDAAKRAALSNLDKGFHLGGEIRTTREDWHER
jgi:predicted transcriptional regulator